MTEEIMNTKEVARYLNIHEKQVYALIKAKKIPATRITGKWIFPRKLIDEWVESNVRSAMEKVRVKARRIEGALLASGSNDPILDMLKSMMRKAYPEFYLFSANTGSMDGLKALKAGYTDIAWCHLFDPESGTDNISFIGQYLQDRKVVVVRLFCREIGLLTVPGNPLQIKGFEDLAREGVRFINRQEGSGTRLLLDYHLARLSILPSSLAGYESEVYTHLDVGLSICSREADAGIATIAVSQLLGLSFTPIAKEGFNMVLDQSTYFHRSVQAFLDILRSDSFRKKVQKMSGYDFMDAGKIIYTKT